jgi:hypothetical protein
MFFPILNENKINLLHNFYLTNKKPIHFFILFSKSTRIKPQHSKEKIKQIFLLCWFNAKKGKKHIV